MPCVICHLQRTFSPCWDCSRLNDPSPWVTKILVLLVSLAAWLRPPALTRPAHGLRIWRLDDNWLYSCYLSKVNIILCRWHYWPPATLVSQRTISLAATKTFHSAASSFTCMNRCVCTMAAPMPTNWYLGRHETMRQNLLIWHEYSEYVSRILQK